MTAISLCAASSVWTRASMARQGALTSAWCSNASLESDHMADGTASSSRPYASHPGASLRSAAAAGGPGRQLPEEHAQVPVPRGAHIVQHPCILPSVHMQQRVALQLRAALVATIYSHGFTSGMHLETWQQLHCRKQSAHIQPPITYEIASCRWRRGRRRRRRARRWPPTRRLHASGRALPAAWRTWRPPCSSWWVALHNTGNWHTDMTWTEQA